MGEIQEIYKLIPLVMAEVGAIAKNSRNEQQKYKFRGIDDVMTAFWPALSKHKLFFVPEVLDKEVTERETKSGSTLIYTTLMVAYTLCAPDGSSIRAIVAGEAMDSGDKSTNKAMSAALKYFLLQTFCIPVEADDDADSQTHEVKGKPASQDKASHATPPASNGAMTEREKLLAEAKELAEAAGNVEVVRQLKSFSVDRISALTDAQLPKFNDGMRLFLKRQKSA